MRTIYAEICVNATPAVLYVFQVHIQTIGILVGEKQELQASLSQVQKKYEIKQSKCCNALKLCH